MGGSRAVPVYGSFPSDMRARPESLFARAERKRGISVPSLPCPSLVIYGDEFREECGLTLVSLYGPRDTTLRASTIGGSSATGASAKRSSVSSARSRARQ